VKTDDYKLHIKMYIFIGMNKFMKWVFGVLGVVSFIGLSVIKSQAWTASGSPVSSSVFVTEDNYGQMAVDASGNVYVTGVTPSGINKYDSSGNLLFNFGPSSSAGIAITSDGDIVVTDWDASFGIQAVYKYDSSGNPIDISSTDMGDGIFTFAYGVAADSLGNVYVSDFQGNGDADMVRKFDSAGNLIATITANTGNYDQIQAVSVDGDDNLYILDSGNARIEKFNSSGAFQTQITANGAAWSYPEGFTVDSAGNIYVMDSGNNRIQIFDTAGTFLQELDATDIGLVGFNYLAGAGISADGKLYVGNYSNVVEVVFDHADPTPSITALPGNTTSDTTPTITGSATDTQTAITAVEYSIDGGAYAACSADDATFDELTEAYSCTVNPALSLASHTIEVRATDSKSNVNTGATIASYTFTVSAATPTPSAAASATPSPSEGTTTSTNTHCSALPPVSAPNIFSVSRDGGDVTISFSPITSNVTNYQLMYGHSEGDERFSATFDAVFASGALKYTVHDLVPSQKYYFWMRAMNGCAPGPWSNTVSTSEIAVEGTTEKSPSPEPVVSPTPQPSGKAETETTTIVIVDSNKQPVGGAGVTLDYIPPSDQVEDKPTLQLTTNQSGEITTDEISGKYSLVVKVNESLYRTTIEIKNGESRVTVAIPLKSAVDISLIQSLPLDTISEEVVKTGAVVVGAGVGISAVTSLVGISQLITASLFKMYSSVARSIWHFPFDYLAGLFQYGNLSFNNLLITFFPALIRKRRTHGLVFNAASHNPLNKAYVLLFSQSGNLHTSFTDENGRYAFAGVAPDDYQLRSELRGYIFPSSIITTSSTLDIPNIYVPGTLIPVEKDGTSLQEIAIAMDPDAKVNPLVKAVSSVTGATSALLAKISIPLYAAAALFLALAVWINPSRLNIIAAIVTYLYLVIKYRWYRFIRKTSGLVLDPDKKPMKNVMVKLYKQAKYGQPGELYSVAQTDDQGRYQINPEQGDYVLKVVSPQYGEIVRPIRVFKNTNSLSKPLSFA
jgi:sugar lactone lactonase YvrE